MGWQNATRSRPHAIERQVPSNRVLDENFWMQFGPVANPTMREKIILVTIDDVGRVGAATFNVKLVCDALNVSYSLINHHFGGRDELIAEASIRWYELYVEALWAAALDAAQNPEDRLRAWLRANVDWSSRYNGMSALLDYPTASSNVSDVISANHRAAMTEIAELNLARLVSLVIDVRRNEVGLYTFARGSVNRENLLAGMPVSMAAGAIAWSILGMSVWKAGRHLPTSAIDGVPEVVDALEDYFIEHLVDLARRG